MFAQIFLQNLSYPSLPFNSTKHTFLRAPHFGLAAIFKWTEVTQSCLSLWPHGPYSSWNSQVGYWSGWPFPSNWAMREALLSIKADSKASTSQTQLPCVSLGRPQTTQLSLCVASVYLPLEDSRMLDCPKCRDKGDLKIEDCLARLVWDQFLNRAWSVTFIREEDSLPRPVWKVQFQRLASPGHSDSALLGALKPVRQLRASLHLHSSLGQALTLLGMLSVSRKGLNKRPCDAVVDQPGLPSQPCLWPKTGGPTSILWVCEEEGGGAMSWPECIAYHTFPSYSLSCKYIQQPFCKQPMCPTREDWANKKVCP